MAVSRSVVSLRGKKIVAPLLDHATTHTIVAGIGGVLDAEVTVLPSDPETIHLGKRFSSGRECYPYIVTLSDILSFFYNLPPGENENDYVLIYPQAHGPCRFGQYHTAINLVLDREGFSGVTVVSPTTEDAYTLQGQLTKEEGKALRLVMFNSIVAGDILNRMHARTRPYEKEAGLADSLYEEGLDELCSIIREYSRRGAARSVTPLSSFEPVFTGLRKIAEWFNAAIDPLKEKKPVIGIIGEIYLRMHTPSNRDIAGKLESFGCETITASLTEWINYTTYMRKWDAARGLRAAAARPLRKSVKHAADYLMYTLTELYQIYRMRRGYKSVSSSIDIPQDHSTGDLFDQLDGDYIPDLHGEAILSIALAKTWFREGCHGVVNVMPFGCMPGNNADWVLSGHPDFIQSGFPYLALDYDDTVNPTTDPLLAVFSDKARRYMNSGS